jgi:hypothetical protein
VSITPQPLHLADYGKQIVKLDHRYPWMTIAKM